MTRLRAGRSRVRFLAGGEKIPCKMSRLAVGPTCGGGGACGREDPSCSEVNMQWICSPLVLHNVHRGNRTFTFTFTVYTSVLRHAAPRGVVCSPRLVKAKVKVTLELPRRPKGGEEVQLYSFFNLGARWGGRSAPRPGRLPGTHCMGGWVGLRAGLDGCGKSCLHRDSIAGPSSP
jgi:hypothetical protein